MQIKWIAIFSGLNLYTAILIRDVLCVPQSHESTRTKDNYLNAYHPDTLGISNGILIKAIVFYASSNCTGNKDCPIVHSSCKYGSCFCDSGYMKLSSRCLKKADIHQYCEFDAQCAVGHCRVAEDCRCNFGAGKDGFCEFNDPMFVSTTGMMKVVVVITGCILVATVTCVITVLYRRVKPRTISRVPVVDMRDVLEDGINPVPSLDSPPLYEEVVKTPPASPTQDYVDPPSYGEYLEHQRYSLQPMIETHNSVYRQCLSTTTTTRTNESHFLGHF